MIDRSDTLAPVAHNATCPTLTPACSPPAATTIAWTNVTVPTPSNVISVESDSQSSTTISLTNVTVPTPSDVISVKFDCQSSNTYYSTRTGDVFTRRCGIDVAAGTIGNNGWPVRGVMKIVAYTMNDCMDACSGYNKYNGPHTCQAVTFSAYMARFYARVSANCWLINATGPGTSLADPASGAVGQIVEV